MREWINTAKDKIIWFFNQPVPILGCALGALLLMGLLFFSKTSIGRRALNELRNKIELIVAEYKAYKESKEKQVEEIRKACDERVEKAEAMLYEAQKLIDLICENSHNKKIQEGYATFKAKTEKIKTNFEAYIEEKVTELHSGELDELKSQLSELSKKVETTLEKAENDKLEELVEEPIEEEVLLNEEESKEE